MSENPSGQGGEISRWYVLTHLEPDQVEPELSRERDLRRSSGETFDYFVPFLFIKRRMVSLSSADADPLSAYDNPRSPRRVEFNNALRRELHDYVFVRSTERLVNYLVRETEWNRNARIRLRFYRDPLNAYATVRSDRMSGFIQACSDQREQFELVDIPASISLNDHVIINTGAFRGQTATVLAVRHTPKGILFDVGFELFAGQKMMRLAGLTRRQLLALPAVPADISGFLKTGADPIEDAQVTLLDILRRKVLRLNTPGDAASDSRSLTRIAGYSRLQVQTPSARNHLLALLLICACLRRDHSDEDRYTESCLEELTRLSSDSPTDVHAYFWIALYIATRRAVYRDFAKRYVQQHNPRSPRLRQFVTLIRKRSTL